MQTADDTKHSLPTGMMQRAIKIQGEMQNEKC